MRKMLVLLTEKDAERLCVLLQKCATALQAINGPKSRAA